MFWVPDLNTAIQSSRKHNLHLIATPDAVVYQNSINRSFLGVMSSKLTKKLLPPNVPVILEGRNIILEPILMNKINDKYLAWLNNTKVNKFMYTSFNKQTLEDIICFINALRTQPGCELFAILTKRNSCHVGNISIREYDLISGFAHHGIMVGDLQAQSMGVGGEASALLIEYIFQDTRIRRMYASCNSNNLQAWKLLKSLGYKREGVLRKHLVLSTGEICDEYTYGILREEWSQTRMKYTSLIKDIQITKL